MTTRRIQKPIDPSSGTRLSYDDRKRTRTEVDAANKKASQQERQEAKRQAAFAPPPEPLPTMTQRQAQRQAEADGRRDAEYKAERIRESNTPIVSPYAARIAELENRGYVPGAQRKLEHFRKLNAKWQADYLAKQEALARQAIINQDPQVILAKQNAEALLKLSPADFHTEIGECIGVANSGDSKLAWQRMRDLEQRIYQHQDRIAAEKLASKSVTDAEFAEAAKIASEARDRFAKTASMVVEPPPEAS